MSGLLEKEQSRATIIGSICENLVRKVLEAKREAGFICNIKIEEPVVEIEIAKDEEVLTEASGNFVLDFSFIRKSDEQPICLWVSHRAKSDNSHTYFWGLVDEVRQVRKRNPNAICVFVILGNKRGWKDWIFPASLLFFDYTVFVGGFRGNEEFDFVFERSKILEKEAKKRLITSKTEDIDVIIQSLLDKSLQPDFVKKLVVDALENNQISEEHREFASKISYVYRSLETCLFIQDFEHNPYVSQLYTEISKLSKHTNSASEIITSVHKTGILEATCYLYTLLLKSVNKVEIIEILKNFYENGKLAEDACASLIKKRIIIEDDSKLHINPAVILALIRNLEQTNSVSGLCTRDDLIEEFVYKSIISKLSPGQYKVLQNIKSKHLLSKGIDYVLDTIRCDVQQNKSNRILDASKPSLISLLNILQKRKSIIQRREETLFDFLSILTEKGAISEKSGRLKTDCAFEVDQIRWLFIHNLVSRTELFDSYVLFLNKHYLETAVEKAWNELIQAWKTGNLIEVIEKQDENGLRVVFETAIYAFGKSPTAVRNAAEKATASTGIWAFLRGDRDVPESVKQSIGEYFKKQSITSDKETIAKEIFKKRIQQIKRNSRINVLEELVFASLIQGKFIFLGTPEKQGDVYLRSILSDVGLKCKTTSSAKGRVEKRGEDFVVPTNSGICIAIQCRASPQSYEARRMAGHSIQFDLEFKDDKWTLRKDLVHIAVVDGHWKKEWIENLLDAGYDKVFSADEMNQLIEYLQAKGAIKSSSDEYFKELHMFQSSVGVREVTPKEIIEKIVS